jgi:excisionase family DNA binding protein
MNSNAKNARADIAGWQAQSLCREHPTHLWFTGDQRETLLAKSVCGACGVRPQCLEFALSRSDLLGIWAATTASERASMRRRERPLETVPPEAIPPEAAGADTDTVELAPSRRRRAVATRDPFVAHTDLLTPAEAARRLGVTPNTVTRWSRAGKISAIQTVGGHRRFRRIEIDRLLDEDTVAASPAR